MLPLFVPTCSFLSTSPTPTSSCPPSCGSAHLLPPPAPASPDGLGCIHWSSSTTSRTVPCLSTFLPHPIPSSLSCPFAFALLLSLAGSWMWRWISGVGCQQGGAAVSPRLPTSGGWFNPRPMNRIPPHQRAHPTPLHLRSLMNSPPQEKDTDLPVCSPFSVCSKVDTYGAPFLEKQCRCPGAPCSSSMHTRDGHTIHDRTKQFKVRLRKNFHVQYLTLCQSRSASL